MVRAQGHGVNGSTMVSKTTSVGSNPTAPAILNNYKAAHLVSLLYTKN